MTARDEARALLAAATPGPWERRERLLGERTVVASDGRGEPWPCPHVREFGGGVECTFDDDESAWTCAECLEYLPCPTLRAIDKVADR